MKPRVSRRAAIGAAACAALAATLAGCSRAPAGPEALVPGLESALSGIARVTIEQQDDALVLVRDGAHWRIEEAGWRADRRWLQPLLLNLAQARCDEPRTADAARFGRIGVAWPPAAAEAEPAGTTAFARPTGRITLDVGGRERHVVIGFPHPDGGTFVRVEGAPHSCLTRVDLRLPARTREWFDPRIWAEAPQPPASVVVEDAGAPALTLRRVGERYVADGQAISVSPLPDALVSALLGLRQNDVRAAADAAAPRVLRFESPAGAMHAVALRREGEQVWARILTAPPSQGGGFEGREFLLPPDVATPLLPSRQALGGS